MALNLKDDQEIFTLRVDETAKAHLLETMRWTRFTGIIFSIVILLVCVLMAFMFIVYMPGAMQTPVPNAGAMVGAISVVAVGVNFYPIFALLRFSTLIKRAMQTVNQQQFNLALRYLRNLFRYIGILTIILILFYGLAFFAGIMAGR